MNIKKELFYSFICILLLVICISCGFVDKVISAITLFVSGVEVGRLASIIKQFI